MWNFQEVLLITLSLFENLKLMSVLFIHALLVYKLETFTNCKEVKHIMIMIIVIIAITYIFLSYEIFDQQLIPSHPPTPLKKSTSPFLLTPPLEIQKVQVRPFLPTLKIFQAPPAEKGWGSRGHYAFFSKNGIIFPNFGLIK